MQDVCVHDLYFLHKSKACKVINLSFHSKMYKCNENDGLWFDVDAFNKYYKIEKNIATKCLKQFVKVL